MTNFQSLIDPTEFRTVRQSLGGSGSPITHILFVSQEGLLTRVAELLTDTRPTPAQRTQFAQWLRDGSLRVGVHHPSSTGDHSLDARVDLESIPDEAVCRVLFLPPYYLVHVGAGVDRIVTHDREWILHH